MSSETVAALAEAVGTYLASMVRKLLPAATVSVLDGDRLGSRFDREVLMQHSNLSARQFIKSVLEKRQLESGSSNGIGSEKLIRNVKDKRLKFESTEPPVLRVLDTLCHNELMRAMGIEHKKMIRVTRQCSVKLCAPFFDLFESRTTICDRTKASSAQVTTELRNDSVCTLFDYPNDYRCEEKFVKIETTVVSLSVANGTKEAESRLTDLGMSGFSQVSNEAEAPDRLQRYCQFKLRTRPANSRLGRNLAQILRIVRDIADFQIFPFARRLSVCAYSLQQVHGSIRFLRLCALECGCGWRGLRFVSTRQNHAW